MSEDAAPYVEDESIRFRAQVFKLQTLIDGGVRLTLDLDANPETIVKLFGAKQPGIFLEVAAVAVLSEKQEENRKNGEIPARSKWQS